MIRKRKKSPKYSTDDVRYSVKRFSRDALKKQHHRKIHWESMEEAWSLLESAMKRGGEKRGVRREIYEQMRQ